MNGGAIPSDAVIYRFPTGGSEYHLTGKIPAVGDPLERGRELWVVAAVDVQQDGTTVVTLKAPEPALEPAQAVSLPA